MVENLLWDLSESNPSVCGGDSLGLDDPCLLEPLVRLAQLDGLPICCLVTKLGEQNKLFFQLCRVCKSNKVAELKKIANSSMHFSLPLFWSFHNPSKPACCCYLLLAICYLLLATSSFFLLLASSSCFLFLALIVFLLASCGRLFATCYLLLSICHLLLAACNLVHSWL